MLNQEQALANPAERTLFHILDIICEGVWDWNALTGHVERSPGWYRMLGYDVDILPNTVFTWEDIIHPDDYPRVMRHFEDYISGSSDRYEVEYRCRKANGEYLWIRDQGKIVERKADGSITRMIGAHLNIHDQMVAQAALQRQNELLHQDKFTLEHLVDQRTEELKEANRKLLANLEQIDRLSNRDYLTAIFNRQKAETELHREFGRAIRYKSALSVALFDIDNFKLINDGFGHSIGDEVLKGISSLVLDHKRETDILSRWGGDEFFIILPGIDTPHALGFIEKIRKLISEAALIASRPVTCSFGVTEFSEQDSIQSLYKRADMALYQSKTAGRNRVTTC